MKTVIDYYQRKARVGSFIHLVSSADEIPEYYFAKDEIKLIKTWFRKEKKNIYSFDRISGVQIIVVIPDRKPNFTISEDIRRLGSDAVSILQKHKIEEIYIDNYVDITLMKSFLEGLLLANYKFLKYKGEKKEQYPAKVLLKQDKAHTKLVRELKHVTDAVFHARNLINEPLSGLSAENFADFVEKTFSKSPVKIEILNKSRIKALKMGGLLGVNRGSKDKPVFVIMEYKPEKAANSKPYVLVGKGVMYDTGGMNLKPGPSMADMKCDMSGGAAVVGAMYAVAKNKLPVHVVGLVPATDNRTGSDAYVPGDVLKMYNGKTVEVLNTDAEGRLILADAIAYAEKYNPKLIIDIATLTGAAHAAIGDHAIVGMTGKAKSEFQKLQKAGEDVFERIVEFPFWDEYGELLKSDIADLANIGGRYAGAITAGKFLENFTDAPYIHLDIAGPAYLPKKWNYWPKGGTGVGVRLFYQYLKSMTEK